jgi:hypothetical protein
MEDIPYNYFNYEYDPYSNGYKYSYRIDGDNDTYDKYPQNTCSYSCSSGFFENRTS